MTEIVKGFKDYSGEEAQKRTEVRKTIINVFEAYGFEPAETPIIEQESFVKGNNANDEAVSDVFKLQDKGKRNLALRYEFTFQLKRLFNNKKIPYKRYQIGEVFRDEPATSNRLRQFTQCDVDIVGSSIKEEAEILSVVNDICLKIGIKPIILINNRGLLNEILQDTGIKEKDKLQVLREIDKYGKISDKELRANLKRLNAENMLNSLQKGEKYFSQFPSYKDIISLMEYCKLYGIKALFSPTVVRGLSYYNGSVFEVKTQSTEGVTQDSIAGGGSYLVDGIQATGISFGLERITRLAKINAEKEKYLIISLSQDKEAIMISKLLRLKGNSCTIYYGKPSKALDYANSYNFQKVIFVGEKETKSRKFKVKDMKSGKESALKI